MKVGIIGGGAAGFFSAITAKENHPDAQVTIFEKSQKLLAKVKISGGGRCNLTNGCGDINEFVKAYPRGARQMKKAFRFFNNRDAMEWFEARGVPLVTQSNNYVFPKSQNSHSIIDCFLGETTRLEIVIKTGLGIKTIRPVGDMLELEFDDETIQPAIFDKVIVATGGSPKRSGLDWLEKLDHKIADPVPSLFTFNMPDESITKLMGVTVKDTLVNILGVRLHSSGSLLITHWGMSGPAILKLSAFGARLLSDLNYNFKVRVNWTGESNHELVREHLINTVQSHPHKTLPNVKPYLVPERLWLYLLEKNNFPHGKKWGELGKKGINKLTTVLTNDEYTVKGKTTFKEEFVTCGGVSLDSIDFNSMQSKVCNNLYFAGEILDIDAITGGYNFQAAWTTAFIAGQLN